MKLIITDTCGHVWCCHNGWTEVLALATMYEEGNLPRTLPYNYLLDGYTLELVDGCEYVMMDDSDDWTVYASARSVS